MSGRPTGAALGIDLGTTQSVVAQAGSGGASVIPNAEGSPTTPSVVLFDGAAHVVVGAAALHALSTDPESVVQLVKRRMGSTWAFEQDGLVYRPEHISALILRKLVTDAGRLTGPVGQAVVTVPAYFNDSMRQATRTAAALAGLDVVGLLAEPTAAAIAFGYDQRPEATTGIVVDLGGGTFDITVLDFDGGDLRVRATGGDAYLGGANFDKVLFDHFVDEFRREHDFDLNDPDSLSIEELTLVSQEWLARATTLKHDLSVRDRSAAQLHAGGRSLRVEMSRQDFVSLSRVLIDEMSAKVLDLLGGCGLRRSDIGVVLSVGGSTRIPAVRDRLRDLLGREPETSVRPDEAVALGAALFAARRQLDGGTDLELDADTLAFLEDLRVADVSPHGIGVGIVETMPAGQERPLMSMVLPQNAALETAHTRRFYTALPGETEVIVPLMEGDTPEIASRIGEVVIEHLPPGRAAHQAIDVTLRYDADGILAATATDVASGRRAAVRIQRDGRPTRSTTDRAAAAVQGVTIG